MIVAQILLGIIAIEKRGEKKEQKDGALVFVSHRWFPLFVLMANCNGQFVKSKDQLESCNMDSHCLFINVDT